MIGRNKAIKLLFTHLFNSQFQTLDINHDGASLISSFVFSFLVDSHPDPKGFISPLEVELFERHEATTSRDDDDDRPPNEYLIKAMVKSFMRSEMLP